MYKKEPAGNTIIRKKFRQHRCYAIRQQISTYLIHIRKDYFHIDTRFFTASTAKGPFENNFTSAKAAVTYDKDYAKNINVNVFYNLN